MMGSRGICYSPLETIPADSCPRTWRARLASKCDSVRMDIYHWFPDDKIADATMDEVMNLVKLLSLEKMIRREVYIRSADT